MPVEEVKGDAIEAELDRIGTHLKLPVTLVLFGGCSMTLQRIKLSTKDVDAVLLGGDAAFPAFRDALEAAGYESAEEITDLGSNFAVFYRDGGIDLDLFPPSRIFDTLHFSQEMGDRTILHAKYGALTVRKADPSTMFLFKCITNRWNRDDQQRLPLLERRDLTDLVKLAPRTDWAFVEQEWARQTSGPDHGEAARRAAEAVQILRDEGIHVGWTPAVD